MIGIDFKEYIECLLREEVEGIDLSLKLKRNEWTEISQSISLMESFFVYGQKTKDVYLDISK